MTDDYTLVIPTYNRPRLLAGLLGFLAAEGADFPIVVLDSSGAESRARNRALVNGSGLALEYVEYSEDVPPFEKFREGVHRIRTPFGSLCADDDLVLVDGIRRCLEHLRAHTDVCVAHGYYFTFLDRGADGIELTAMLYFTPGIDDDEPLRRVRALLRSYQALTYGVYRTAVLRSVFDGVRSVESLLARELLSGMLSVVHGKVTRLRCFYGGRSHNPSERYRHWHPLEWLIESPQGLLEEYGRMRRILLGALTESTTKFPPAEVARLLDLMHTFYLIVHAPQESHEFILDRIMAGDDLDAFWPDPMIQQPLVTNHYATAVSSGTADAAPSAGEIGGAATPRSSMVPGWLARWRRRLGWRNAPGVASVTEPRTWPRAMTTPARVYRMHQNFLEFEPSALRLDGANEISALLASLDQYRVAAD